MIAAYIFIKEAFDNAFVFSAEKLQKILCWHVSEVGFLNICNVRNYGSVLERKFSTNGVLAFVVEAMQLIGAQARNFDFTEVIRSKQLISYRISSHSEILVTDPLSCSCVVQITRRVAFGKFTALGKQRVHNINGCFDRIIARQDALAEKIHDSEAKLPELGGFEG